VTDLSRSPDARVPREAPATRRTAGAAEAERRPVPTIDNDWFKDAVIYELHVRAFCDSNADGTGDFDGLTSKLDYLVELGVTAIWLLPFYPSPLRDDGYDIADYRIVNPDYGTMRAFKRFLGAAHDRGLRVITELVINHTSDQHPWFQRARSAPKGSVERDFYVWTDDPTGYADARVIFQDFEASNWTWDPVAEQYYWHRFYHHQPDLNFESPAVREAVMELLDYWLDMGVDGLRLDAIPYLFEREGTNCENLPETHEFLKELRARMDVRYGDRMLLAEANQWPEDAVAYFGAGDECHMNFHFPLMPRMFMALQTENRTPITDILEQTPLPPDGCQWATFLRNHDELTLEMVTDEERQLMLRAYARDREMRINLGIRRRLAPLLGNDRRKIELLNALLFSLPGTPVLYYGDEIGMGDNVYLGDRNGVRTPMQWSADRNAGFSAGNPHRLFLPLITEPGYHYEIVNVDHQVEDPTSLLSWMRQMIALRKRRPMLGRGSIRFLEPENQHVLAFVRDDETTDEPPFLCVANLSRLAQHVELDLREFDGAIPVEAFGQTRFAPVTDLPYHVTLQPYAFFWFSLEAPDRRRPEHHDPPALAGSWAEVLRRRAPLGRALAAWLPHRRWYAGKESAIRELSIEESIGLHGDVDVALLIVRVSYTEGDDHRYAVPVMRATDRMAQQTVAEQPAAVIARLDHGDLLVDAMVRPEGAAVVVRAALRRQAATGRHGAVRGAPRRSGLAKLVAGGRDVQPLGVEQSNSSVMVAHTLIAKLVRRLEAGANPDAELVAHLAARGFAHVPGLAATLEVDLVGESSPADVMVVHDAIPNEGDLWRWTLDELSVDLEQRGRFDADESTLWLAELLGRRTAELHIALADGDDADTTPEPFTLLWQRALLQTLRNSARATQRALRRARVDTEHAAFVLRPVDDVLARFETLRSRKLDARRIRVHGDLHLGQVLRSGTDVVFIDFEGEPGRPIGERRIKRSPLVDVAGLVRSLDYAGRSALDTAVARGLVPETEHEALDRGRAAWTTSAAGLLVDTYLGMIADADLVPAERHDAELLLDVYQLQKGLYEIRYELANRPDWVHWPLSAVAEMIRGS
jgi:maltose alpha-D-glucosyltransferase / alpha-amylase